MAPHFVSHRATHRSVVRRRLWHGRVVDSRMGRHPRKRHAADSGSQLVPARSVHGSIHAGNDCRRDRPGDQAALRPRSALHRTQGGAVFGRDRAWPIRLTSGRRRSSSFSTACASTSASSMGFTSSTQKRDGGIRGGWRTISAIVRATRKVISRCRPRTTTRICAARWWSRCRTPA